MLNVKSDTGMCEPIYRLLDDFNCNEAAQSDWWATATSLRLPEDYRAFIAKHNGGEGFIGKHYLILWRAEQIVPFNRDCQVDEYAPGIILFASRGGGEAFGFNMRSDLASIGQVPLIGLELRYAIKVANSFTELLLKMSCSDGSLLW